MNTSNWPVPESSIKEIPKKGEPGGFWEKRGDRFHCGADIYATKGSKVYSIKKGEVIDIGVFTSPKMISYWNKTFYVDIKNDNGFIFRYAELEKTNVSKKDKVKEKDLIGFVGQVLNPDRIDDSSPMYILKLKEKSSHSMLHFETYKKRSLFSEKKYLGGNWFGNNIPGCSINPASFLKTK